MGTPPTAVFVGKLTTATAAWESGLAWLAILAFANTLARLFYYLRWIIPVYRGDESNDTIEPVSVDLQTWSTRVAVTTATATLLLGVAAGAIWTVADGLLAR